MRYDNIRGNPAKSALLMKFGAGRAIVDDSELRRSYVARPMGSGSVGQDLIVPTGVATLGGTPLEQPLMVQRLCTEFAATG
jgi:hypothetical protein